MGKKHEKRTERLDTTSSDAGHMEQEHREDQKEANPPRTTSGGWLTTPKFGSSTSGGGEIEPGPERD